MGNMACSTPSLKEADWLSVSFSNFVMLLKWQSTIRIFSQIWQYSKYESKKKSVAPFHVVGSCDKFWLFFRVFIPFLAIFFSPKNQAI
jgi:hypothetical protein